MNTARTLIAAAFVALFAATGAIAQEATPDHWTQTTSTLARAQVRAEAMAALQLGLTGRGEASAPSATPAQAEWIRQSGLRALSVPVAQTAR